MRISQIQANADYSVNSRAKFNPSSNAIGLSASVGVNAPHNVITFGGVKNKNHVLHVLAELPPWMKVGGVATVGKDYMNMAGWMDELKAANPDIAAALGDGKSKVSLIIPYYNGVIGAENSVSVRTDASGNPIWVNDVNAKKYAYNPAGLSADKDAVTRLREVASTDMQWGLTKSTPARLFQIVDHPALKGKDNVDVYMLFTEEVARMPRAYANGDYCSEPKAKELKKKLTAPDDLASLTPAKREEAVIKAYTSSQPYHQFSKGVVETVKKAGLDAETIICSDSQTMLIPDFIAQQAEAGDEFYKGAKTTGVFHNTGAVYCGECSAKDLFLAQATPEQIEMVRKSPEYVFAREIGREEDYFKRFVKGYVDDAGNVNPNMGILRHVQNGNGYVNTVSGEYAKSMALDPAVTPLHSLWKELYDGQKVGGIINGFEDSSVSAFKKLGLKGYTQRIFAENESGRSVSLQPYVTYNIDDMKAAINPQVTTLDIAKDTPFEKIKEQISDLFKEGGLRKAIFHIDDGKGSETVKEIGFASQEELDKLAGKKILGVELQNRPLLEVSKAEKSLIESATEPTLETAKIAKRHNKASFLRRFTEEFEDAFGDKQVKFAETGLPGKDCSVMGSIDKKFISQINAGKDIPLFVSWGRGDFQKGHPIALESFMKFAKTEQGKDALLVMGGELPKDTAEAKKIIELMTKINTDSTLKGRIAFIDGFAPGYAMSSAADFAIFSSRFEPCGLTPAEAQKYFCTPIVLNTQGLSQQIFDPRSANPGEMINGYKTVNEFYMPKDKIDNIISLFATKTKPLDDAAKEQLRADFPYSADDLALFEKFGNKYQSLLKKAKDKIQGLVSQEELTAQAKHELERMPEYSNLINKLKEGILQDELVAAMQQATRDGANPSMAETIFKSHFSLDTSWMGNANLNGVDPQTGRVISSAELYCRRHVMPNPSGGIPKRVFEFREDLVDKSLGDLSISGDTLGASPKETSAAAATFAGKLKEFANGNKKALMIAGGIAAVAAVAGGIIHSNNKKAKIEAEKAASEAALAQNTQPQTQPVVPSPVAPVSMTPVIQPQAPSSLATTQGILPNQASKIDLSNNKFAACFNKIA